MPGLDLSDSDDDATWTPFKDKEKADNPALGRHKRYVGMVSNESFSFLHTNTEGVPKLWAGTFLMYFGVFTRLSNRAFGG